MLAIISDIHGNFPALQAVLNEIDKMGCTKIISLGDVAGYYCMINECIEELKKRKIPNVLGNHDKYIAFNSKCPRSNAANECLEYQRSIITKENIEWLKKSEKIIQHNNISFVHGGWQEYTDEYLYELSNDYFQYLPFKYFFSGHTHVPILYKLKNKTYCNPGSVGQPRDGDKRASFAVIDDNNIISIKKINYDVDIIANEMQKSGFDKYFYENLYFGTRIGGKISKVITL